MDITLVYFVYGLAFFSMGLAMLMESNRSPLLAQPGVLLPLAIFGFVHGSHEWLEMFLDKSDWVVFQNHLLVSWIRIGVLSISFISLDLFGLRALSPSRHPSLRENLRIIGGLCLYVIAVILVSLIAWADHVDPLAHADAMVRYLVAIPGAALAGVALMRQAFLERSQERAQLARMLRLAALGFILYSFTQAVVPPFDVFPGNLLNTVSFTAALGFPVQIVRAVMAALITISLIRATQIVDDERRRQLLTAQEERLEALEAVQQELLRREALREELLRHTVIAQEEERARIARELHDEMAQILTGFTLHLATLCDYACDHPDVRNQVDRLNSLSQQMSASLYRLVHDLRPAQLDDLGLVAALQYLVDDTHNRIGLQAKLVVDGKQRRLDPLVETVLFRCAQEALTNVARHAGVNEAAVRLSFEPEGIRLRISDTGAGFVLGDDQLPEQSWGLAGMRERVYSVGGQLSIDTKLGRGTLVEVLVPNGKE